MKMFDRRPSRKDQRIGGNSRRRCRLILEALEDRRLMTGGPELFAFGTTTPPVAGAIPVYYDAYNAATGYGWTSGQFGASSSPGSNALLSQFDAGQAASFRVDLPDGTYTVAPTFGNYGGFSQDVVTYAGQVVASAATTPGQFYQPTFQAAVTDGELTLQLSNAGNYYPFEIDSLQISALGSTGPTTPPAPTANAGGPYNAVVGDPLTFAGSGSDSNASDTAAGFTYTWNFGDGSQAVSGSNLTAPSHTYAAAGSYTVQETVTDEYGDSGTATAAVTVVPSSPANPPPESGYIVTPWDTIPDFGANPTIVSVASGSWSAPSTWSGGRIPTTGDIVDISPGTSVTYDTVSNAAIETVEVQSGGDLQFRTDISTQLTVVNLLVLSGGSLEVGTPNNPVAANVTAKIIIANQPLNTSLDPAQYGNGLIALGNVTMVGAAKTPTFDQLAVEPMAGDTTLTFATPVTGWTAGDTLVIPDTRQLTDNDDGANYVPEYELVTVQSISANGTTVTLTAPLQYDHLGARDPDGNLVDMPDVEDLTRNVVVRSADGNGTRGYTLFTDQADVDIQYVQFAGLGRTTDALGDNTTFDASGDVTHLGTNEMGRYPVTFDNLIGPSTTPADGYQFTFVGNSVYCPIQPMNFRWGIDINGSSYGLIQDNVLYNWAGAGIIAENGNDIGNVINHNMVVLVTGTGSNGGDLGREGAGFWLSNPDNVVTNNVASDIGPYTNTNGTALYSPGFEYYFTQDSTATVVPAYPGADPLIAGQGIVMNPDATPILEFSGNTVYGATAEGMSYYYVGTDFDSPYNVGISLISDLTIWHVTNIGVYAYQANNVTFDGLSIVEDANALTQQEYGAEGFIFSDYFTDNFAMENSTIEGAYIGMVLPVVTQGVQQINNTTFWDATDVISDTLWSVAYTSGYIQPEKVVLTDDMFDIQALPGYASPVAIDMEYSPGSGVNLIQQDQVFVVNYNDVSGDDFQVYYMQQAADFVVPQTVLNSDGTPNEDGAPVAGLTNSQAWQEYGIAIAGAVAPATAVEEEGILGLVNPD
jgi:PKD domain/G8 domain